MKKVRLLLVATAAIMLVSTQSCKKEEGPVGPQGVQGPSGPNGPIGPVGPGGPGDPDNAPHAMIDRFSSVNAPMGKMFIRTSANGFPGKNAPINFDANPMFASKCLGPNGEKILYYHFDVMPTATIPVWVFVDANGKSVPGQRNIIDVIPTDAGYNDFWQVVKVTVPSGYVANTIRSKSTLQASGYTITSTQEIVNCPVVPEGSVATKRYDVNESASLHKGWYKDSVVYYFTFMEKALTGGTTIGTSPVYAAFNINPDMSNPNSGPASGVMAEASGQNHNVMATIPTNATYSPMWAVWWYNNANFSTVTNLTTALATTPTNTMMNVNCPSVVVTP